MQWLKNKIIKWASNDRGLAISLDSMSGNSRGNRITSVQEINSNGMTFTVYRANGGHIIEHRVYDKRTDRTTNGLHIITDDKDLGEEIGKIITYEQLRS
jgi:hypothetical protein